MNEILLEKLTDDFCLRFIKVIKDRENRGLKKLIGLYGADKESLIYLKNNMADYFRKRNQQIEIVLERTGYEIDVGYFLNNTKESNTVLQGA